MRAKVLMTSSPANRDLSPAGTRKRVSRLPALLAPLLPLAFILARDRRFVAGIAAVYFGSLFVWARARRFHWFTQGMIGLAGVAAAAVFAWLTFHRATPPG